MKITTVTYAQLLNTGNFENIRIEWTAELAYGDDPEAVTRLLGQRVRAALKEQAKAADQGGAGWVYQDDDGGTIP